MQFELAASELAETVANGFVLYMKLSRLRFSGDADRIIEFANENGDGHLRLRRGTARSLARKGSPSSREYLELRLRRDHDPITRLTAAVSLGWYHDSVDALDAGLADADERVSVACAGSLFRLDDDRASTALAEAFPTKTYEAKLEVIRQARRSHSQVARVMLEVAASDDDSSVRRRAIQALEPLDVATAVELARREMARAPKLERATYVNILRRADTSGDRTSVATGSGAAATVQSEHDVARTFR